MTNPNVGRHGSTGKHRCFPWRENEVNQFTPLEMRRK